MDGLRGLAILLVLVAHFGVGSGIGRICGPWVERICYAGWVGVDLFFVLSGFLITRILLASRTRKNYYGRFWLRRALRILPLHTLFLLLGLVVLPRFWPGMAKVLLADAAKHPLWLWTFTLNLANVFGVIAYSGIFGHLWSLAIEEQFYMAWPLAVRLCGPRRLGWLCAALMLTALALRLAWPDHALSGWWGSNRFPLTRMDSLAAGAALAVLRPGSWSRWGWRAGLLSLLMWFLWVPRFHPEQPGVETWGHSLLAFTFSCLVLEATALQPPAWMLARPLRWLGKYSYGLYVWHFPVFMILLLKRTPPPAFLGIGLGSTVVLALLSYHMLEAQFLRLKVDDHLEGVAGGGGEATAVQGLVQGVAVGDELLLGDDPVGQ